MGGSWERFWAVTLAIYFRGSKRRIVATTPPLYPSHSSFLTTLWRCDAVLPGQASLPSGFQTCSQRQPCRKWMHKTRGLAGVRRDPGLTREEPAGAMGNVGTATRHKMQREGSPGCLRSAEASCVPCRMHIPSRKHLRVCCENQKSAFVCVGEFGNTGKIG